MLSQQFKLALEELARNGVCIGTSSWKYPGWCGQLYDEQRYLTRGKFSEAKFERECLGEYAQTFSTVCVDAGYYHFLSDKWIGGLCAQVLDHFRFGFKVTDEITVKKFPNLPRFGARAGTANSNFLNPELFERQFLNPLEPHRQKIGPLIFEFSTFHKADFEHGRDFVAALDQFLGAIPKGWEYGIEMRNKTWLEPECFETLHRQKIAHVFNSWSRMPPVNEQLAMPESVTTDFLVARFLLTPGRTYEQAVSAFSPYTETKEPDAVAREAGKALIAKAERGKRPSFIYVNSLQIVKLLVVHQRESQVLDRGLFEFCLLALPLRPAADVMDERAFRPFRLRVL